MSLINYTNSVIPRLTIDYEELFSVLYEIKDWEECLNYLKKYKKTILKSKLNRILKYSWRIFEDFKLNLDLIVDIYDIYLEIYNIKKNIDTQKIIYSLKSQNLKKNEIHNYLVQILNK